MLRECQADLAVVLGTRILRPELFSVPRLGSVNLHKGKVPEYRGMPPGFWELYEGERSAGITVHFVSAKLDAGDVVETAEVAILFKEAGPATRVSVRTKPGGVDATELTGAFGGGGHARAAGATVAATLDQARAQVLAVADRLAGAVIRPSA